MYKIACILLLLIIAFLFYVIQVMNQSVGVIANEIIHCPICEYEIEETEEYDYYWFLHDENERKWLERQQSNEYKVQLKSKSMEGLD